MKKILLVVCVLFSFSASAQRYTLQFGQREPTFYYWGRNWIDCCDSAELKVDNIWDWVPSIYLRFFTTQEPLRIIGIASVCRPHPNSYAYNGHNRNEIYDSVCLPEYFQLYKATSSDPVLLAEARWDTAHPRYQVVYNRWLHDSTVGLTVPTFDTIPIYEAFFESPVIVTDSFFAGGTANNNYFHYDEAAGRYTIWEHPTTEYIFLYRRYESDDVRVVCSPSRGMTCKYNIGFYTHEDWNVGNLMANYGDSNWRHNQPLVRHCSSTNNNCNGWLCFFPIIDTTGMGLDGFQWVPGYGCDTVRTFRLLYVEGRQAYLSWSGNRDAAYYEVSYGPEGTAPDQGTKVRTNTSMVCLDSLEPGRRYVAYARTRCTNDAYGGWSDSVSFRIPGSGSAIEDASLASRFTAVMPNPATTQATVMSSFTINRIEVYTAAGQHMLTNEPKANAAALDLSTLSAGTYLLRIQTSAGDTAKKLVVQ